MAANKELEAVRELNELTTNVLSLLVDDLRQRPLAEVMPDLEHDAVDLNKQVILLCVGRCDRLTTCTRILQNANQSIERVGKRKQNSIYVWVWA